MINRSRTVELMPIVWRLGTGKPYHDDPPEQDFAAVARMGSTVIPLLTDWLDDGCRIVQTGAARALDYLTASTVTGIESITSVVLERQLTPPSPCNYDAA